MKLEDVKIGCGAVKGFNGDTYPFYIVGIEKGKYSYNKDKIVGLWLVPSTVTSYIRVYSSYNDHSYIRSREADRC